MLPFTVRSFRKFVTSSVCPVFNLIWVTSEAFTELLPVVSPMRIPIGTLTSDVIDPLFTLVSVTVIVCAFVTPVRLTVTVFVPLPVEDET